MPLFIAYMVSSEKLYEIGKYFERYGYAPVPLENQHLTLLFIGDVDSYHQHLIKRRLATLIVEHSRLLKIERLELLPPHKATNIVAIVRAEHDMLKIRNEMLEMLRDIVKIQDRYSFYPHITIARRSRPASEHVIDEVLKHMKRIEVKVPKTVHVRGLALVSSRGGRYSVELWLSRPVT
ncbi:MAG TPA: RNA 2',3'-cyclic phosphodiesterase [Ignisphaera aggregans]|uniref:RNA 2',3'-cyclic phosphodiesterase n=1 Tax=Ignisphaera aggregans TaxID=334771 RepID=A0A833DUC7_9CREN|nr:RNA 2',3'-cyclic phosphodiesterase [Ignisphaera aggregans]